MIKGISQTNCVIPTASGGRRASLCPNFSANPTTDKQSTKKKSHKLAWAFGIATAITAGIGACIVMAVPSLRMQALNLFRKQASEEAINTAIHKYAKEIAHLKKEKEVFLNPKTGELVHSIQGEKHRVTLDNDGRTFVDCTIIGHNHPSGYSFSLPDLHNCISRKTQRVFVATQKNIYHIKTNDSYDETKFLDYLVNNGIIKLKDRKPKTIKRAILKHKSLIYPISHYESVKESFQRYYSEVKKICNHMGWTYWREPLPV